MSRRERNRDRDKIRYEDLKITSDMTDSEIEAVIRERILWRQRRWRGVMAGIPAYIIVNIILWNLWLPTAWSNNFPWPFFVTLFGAIALIKTIWELRESSDAVQDRRDELIQQQIERAKAKLGRYEKPKNDFAEKSKNRQMRVGSDGEIVPLDQLLSEDDEQDETRYQSNYRQ